MLEVKPYNRMHAKEYAKRWAFERNPLFYSFSGIGGDCTSFISQCVYAGCCVMNDTPTFGWYYRSLNDRAPAWTGVPYFYRFITENEGAGPFGESVASTSLELGDVIQLGDENGRFYHSLLVTGFEQNDYLVSTHSYDAFNRRLSTYSYEQARYIHITGVRTEAGKNKTGCFVDLINGLHIHG